MTVQLDSEASDSWGPKHRCEFSACVVHAITEQHSHVIHTILCLLCTAVTQSPYRVATGNAPDLYRGAQKNAYTLQPTTYEYLLIQHYIIYADHFVR